MFTSEKATIPDLILALKNSEQDLRNDYPLDDEFVSDESEPLIQKKLLKLQEWLYGTSSPVSYRNAPSLIVRSEAELFGISSPRFAIRAYLEGRGFINVRRRALLRGMIERTFEGQDVKDPLLKSLDENIHMWIADSLLDLPPRLVDVSGDEKYEILTVDLGREYGEADGANGRKLSPFVTFISIGGGLCAQAACFTALCLAQSNPLHSISEITKLASRPGVTKIHGLDAPSITKFLSSDYVSVNAQLQLIPKVDAVKHARSYYLYAMKSYIRNGIPLIAIVSSDRMKGCGMHRKDEKPILTANNFELDPSDYSKLPIGFLFNRDPKTQRLIRSKVDNHCVVIVGANDADSFCLHDPATFPFLEATIDQLIDVGANLNYKDNNGEAEARIEILDPTDPEISRQFADLVPPQFIAITPKDVAIPLLDFHESFSKAYEGKAPNFSSQGILRTAFDNQQTVERPEPRFGEFFLANLTNPQSGELESKREGLPEFPTNYLSEINKGWYWIQAIDSSDGEQQFWFWSASDLLNNRDEPDLVLCYASSQWSLRPEETF